MAAKGHRDSHRVCPCEGDPRACECCVSPVVFPNSKRGRWHHRVKRCHNAKFAVNVYCPSGACCAGGDDGPINVYRPSAARRLGRSSDAAPSAERRDVTSPNPVWLCGGLDVRGRDAGTSMISGLLRHHAIDARPTKLGEKLGAIMLCPHTRYTQHS